MCSLLSTSLDIKKGLKCWALASATSDRREYRRNGGNSSNEPFYWPSSVLLIESLVYDTGTWWYSLYRICTLSIMSSYNICKSNKETPSKPPPWPSGTSLWVCFTQCLCQQCCLGCTWGLAGILHETYDFVPGVYSRSYWKRFPYKENKKMPAGTNWIIENYHSKCWQRHNSFISG